MKLLLKIIGGLVACIALLLVVLRFTGLEPSNPPPSMTEERHARPGLWLKGDLVTTPVTDWSFTDKYENIAIQTRTWYLFPHSITTNCLSYNGQLYVFSGYPKGVEYPHGRRWNEDVERDPHVRLKIGNQLYDRVLTHVTDPVERAAVLQARPIKYNRRPQKGFTFEIYHVISE